MVGLDAIKQKTIFQLLSAILHLGNIEFKENGSVAFPTNEKRKGFFSESKYFINHSERKY